MRITPKFIPRQIFDPLGQYGINIIYRRPLEYVWRSDFKTGQFFVSNIVPGISDNRSYSISDEYIYISDSLSDSMLVSMSDSLSVCTSDNMSVSCQYII